MSIGDVISMTLAILDQVEVRGRHNLISMNRAMENLEAIQKALDGASNAATGAEAGETAKPFEDGTGHSPEAAKPFGDGTGHSPEAAKPSGDGTGHRPEAAKPFEDETGRRPEGGQAA